MKHLDGYRSGNPEFLFPNASPSPEEVWGQAPIDQQHYTPNLTVMLGVNAPVPLHTSEDEFHW